MAKRIATKIEKSTLTSLRRWNPDVPEEVLAAEARQRLEARMLRDNEGGERQEAIAARTGYSLSQVERILKSAKRTKAAGSPSPLAAWVGKQSDAVKSEWEAKKTSKPKLAAPEPTERKPVATLSERILEKVDALSARVTELADRTKPGTLTLDGATLDLASYLARFGYVGDVPPKADAPGMTANIEGFPDPAAARTGKAARASIEPVVRIVGGMLLIESGDDTVETRICIPGGGLSYAALLAALPSYD